MYLFGKKPNPTSSNSQSVTVETATDPAPDSSGEEVPVEATALSAKKPEAPTVFEYARALAHHGGVLEEVAATSKAGFGSIRTSLDMLLVRQAQQNEQLKQLHARQEASLPEKVMTALQKIEKRLDLLQEPADGAANEAVLEFAGLWYDEQNASHVIAGNFLCSESAGKVELQVHDRRSFSLTGTTLGHARLGDDGQQLLWSSTKVWTRAPKPSPAPLSFAASQELGRAAPESGRVAPIVPERGTQSTFSEQTISEVRFTWLEKQEQITKDNLTMVRSEFGENLRDYAKNADCGRRAMLKAASCADWVEVQKRIPLPHDRCINKLVDSYTFEILSAVLILLNACYVGYSADWYIQHPLQPATDLMFAVDVSFFCLFSFELMLRIISLGRQFFFGPDALWYVLDMVLLAISAGELAAGGSGGFAFLRTLRVFKLARVIRMVRTVRLFKDLRLLMDCMMGSFTSLIWCLLVISFLFYLFGLVFVQGLADVVSDLEQERLDMYGASAPVERLLGATRGRQLHGLEGIEGPEELIEFIMERYGSVSKAMLRLWEAATGGIDWEQEYRVVTLCGIYHSVVFIGFIAFMMIVVWNIVTSTIVEKALRFAQPDIDQLLMDKRRRDNEDVQLLMEMFEKAGIDLTSRVKENEFLMLLEQRDMADFLQVRGIDIKEAHTFFALLKDDQTVDSVDTMSFIISCLRIKGFATSIDLHTTHHQVMRAMKRHGRMIRATFGKLAQLERRVLGTEPTSWPPVNASDTPTETEVLNFASNLDLLNEQ